MAKIVIVGGGLAGLTLARQFQAVGVDFHVLEARGRLGGRIKGLNDSGHSFDLGPSWYWPGQPRMARLAKDLNIATFDQHASGDLMYETDQGDVQRGVGFASMEGSFRLDGGMTALIDGLASSLPLDCITLNAAAVRVEQSFGVTLSDGRIFPAEHIVLACSPRVAASLEFSPDIPKDALKSIPTWMGGQAKFVATYDAPFWRTMGLSGDAMSRLGPLVEIHDASPQNASLGALFGFVGVPHDVRVDQPDAVIAAALNQLARLFGQAARRPRQAHVEDWATQPETADDQDKTPLMSHPEYGLPSALEDLWNGTLHFGSTEAAKDFGGFLEGALVRAETLAKRILK
jgi:monoamine oxidase